MLNYEIRLHRQKSSNWPGRLATRTLLVAVVAKPIRNLLLADIEAGSPALWTMIAAVTDVAGAVQGVHRTWLAADGQGKAAVNPERRAMGHLLGNAVRLTPQDDILVIGEGIETMLSLSEAIPGLPVWAALSSGHLGAVLLPEGLKRLYIAIDRDPAGQRAAEKLSARASEVGVRVRVLEPRLGDFNDDLRANGKVALRQHLAGQIGPEDRHRLPS